MRVRALILAALSVASGCAEPQLGPSASGGSGGSGGGAAGAGAGWPLVPKAPQAEIVAAGLDKPCAMATANDAVLVADEALGRIVRVPLDGSAPTELVAGLSGPTGLSASGDDVFVTERAAGLVLAVHAGMVTEVASGEVNPGRVRAAGDYVYWLVEGTGAADGALRRASIGQAGPAQTIASALVSPKSLAVGDRVYFTEPVSFKISSVALDGGDEASLTDGFGKPFDVVVASSDQQLFWSALGKRGGGWIHRAGLDFSADAHVAFSPPGPEWLSLAGSDIVWSTFFGLAMAPRAGGAYRDVVLGSVCELAIASGYVYWTDAAEGRVLRILLPGE